MIRTFHSIGQGAFYTEELDGLIMVYDCGGSRKEIIEHEIQNTFEEDQTIDKLFISHFHNDHINGLKFLLSYCNVQTVYLPLLHEKSEIQFLIENIAFGENDPFISDLITNPDNAIHELSRETRVVHIKPRDSDPKGEEDSDSLISSGTEISLNNSSDNCTWVFVPYNFQYDALNIQLCNRLEDNGIDISNIADELKIKQDEIIEVYKTVLGGTKNFNVNSLVLYSGPKEDNECDMYIENLYDPWIHHGFFALGCLYLGDYNVFRQTTMDDLKSVYSNYWNLLGTVQIPHHGSKYNFNYDLVEKNIFAIMSAGKRRRHPHGVTLKAIMTKKAIPLIVTEDMDTQIIQVVHV